MHYDIYEDGRTGGFRDLTAAPMQFKKIILID